MLTSVILGIVPFCQTVLHTFAKNIYINLQITPGYNPEYMLGASKRNLFSANYAVLVITEPTAETGDRQVPGVQAQVRHPTKGSVTQQDLVLLGFLQMAIPQRLVETHSYFNINPTRQD